MPKLPGIPCVFFAVFTVSVYQSTLVLVIQNELILNSLKQDQNRFLDILGPPEKNLDRVYIPANHKVREDVMIDEFGDVYLSNWKLGEDPLYWTLIETNEGYILLPN